LSYIFSHVRKLLSSKNITYVDLFAGIGGFAAAFEAMGFKQEVSAEFDQDAAITYKKFWGHDALNDVTQLAPDFDGKPTIGIKPHTVLSAGFPCQPFSKSGAQLGVLDASRGTLFHNILNAIRTGRPTLVILENVRNLAGPKHFKDLEIIKSSLRALGYRVSTENTFVSPHKIAPEYGGRPQNRERIFIVATKDTKGGKTKLDCHPLDVYGIAGGSWKPQNWDLDQHLLRKVDNSDIKLQISEDDRHVLDAWDALIRLIRKNSGSFPAFPLWADYWGTKPKLAGVPAWKVQIIKKNLDFYSANQIAIESWLRKFKVRSNPIFTPSKRKFEWQAREMGSIFEGLVHFRPSGVRVKPATYLPALVAITQIPILAKYGRRLSIAEAAHLQGLPKHFKFDHQADSKTFKQLGNGVNIGVVWAVLRAAAIRDKDLLLQTAEGRKLLHLIENAPKNPDDLVSRMRMAGK
jgi:DNA (cytosine-5)-methyltransferase 1